MKEGHLGPVFCTECGRYPGGVVLWSRISLQNELFCGACRVIDNINGSGQQSLLCVLIQSAPIVIHNLCG